MAIFGGRSARDKGLDGSYVMPFGRARRDRRRADFGDEHVGRDGERAFLTEALTSGGSQGAYLVTGRRGVGKSSFVETCIEEYESNVFKRFLRSGYGRSVFDLILLIFFVSLTLVAVLVASDLLEQISVAQRENNFLLLFALPLIALTLVPLIYAHRIIMAALKTITRTGAWLWTMVILTSWLVGVAFFGPIGAPTLSLSRFAVAIALLVLIGVTMPPFTRALPWSVKWRSWVVIAFCLLLIVVMAYEEVSRDTTNAVMGKLLHPGRIAMVLMPVIGDSVWGDLPVLYDIVNNVLVSVWLFVIVLLRHAWVAMRAARIEEQDLRKRIVLAGYRSFALAIFVFLASVVLLLAVAGQQEKVHINSGVSIWMVLAFLLVVCFAPQAASSGENSVRRFAPPVAALLVVKGLFFATLSLHLVYPTVNLFPKTFESFVETEHWFGQSDDGSGNQEDGSDEDGELFPPTDIKLSKARPYLVYADEIDMPASESGTATGTDSGVTKEKSDNPYLTLFGEQHEESLWMLIALLVIAILFLVEFDWINRSMIAERQSSALGLSPRFPDHTRAHSHTDPVWIAEARQYHEVKAAPAMLLDWLQAGRPVVLEENESFRTLIATLGGRGYGPDDVAWLARKASRSIPPTPGTTARGLAALLVRLGHETPPITDAMYNLLRQMTGGSRPAHDLMTLIARLCEEKRKVRGDVHDWQEALTALPTIPPDAQERRVASMREIEAVTLPWLIVKVWMPSIVVRVNLGFDTLDHRGVTRAMLFGLRNEYQKKFLNFFSAYSVLVNFVVAMFLALSVSYVGENTFDFPDTRFVIGEAPIASLNNRDKTFIQTVIDECKFSLMEGEYESELCAYYELADKENNWDAFFKHTGSEDHRRGTQYVDYCSILGEIRAMAPRAKGFYTPERKEDGGFRLEPVKDDEVPLKAAVPLMLCNAAPETANALLPILFAELLPIPVAPAIVAKQRSQPSHFAFTFLHDNNGLPVYAGNSIRTTPSLSVRVYHILTFITLLSLWRWLSRQFSIHPYRTTVGRIDMLMQSLDASSTEKRRFAMFEPVAALSRLFVDERTNEVQRDKLDPRSVELALLNVLEDVRHTETGVLRRTITLPVPELTFVFDELDKISGVFGAGTNEASSVAADKTALDAERRRAYALHQLMSDMKRVISSAPARFVFVGNRLLHDEWTADRSRRQPLLTSIFDTEIYLPSLMLDSQGTLGAGQPQMRLSHRIKEYMLQRYRKAQEDYGRFVEDRASGFSTLRAHEPAASVYRQDAPTQAGVVGRPLDDLALYEEMQLLYMPHDGGIRRRIQTQEAGQGTQFLRAFAHFLTFRSGGNPKKLQALLNEFVRPAARLSWPEDEYRWNGGPPTPSEPLRSEPLLCEDVLLFRDRSIYRIQLIDTLYMHLVERFESELLERDDKVSEAILYLFDFLMKFHERAFSWSSLERVEELVHIHRTPDLRAILTRIVEDASERWLHRLLNGMYDFRFRSDFAVELRYLSRLNQPEAAALNFTLDEAQGLKATYIATLQEAESNGLRRDEEAIAGLGELHEYDQEYAEARARYQEAITEADRHFAQVAGETVALYDPVQEAAERAADTEPKYAASRRGAMALLAERPGPAPVPVMHAIMAQDRVGMRVSGVFIPWGIRRLRLMLQVAMTYELARDFEPAKVHYLNARLFAWSLIEMYPDRASGTLGGFDKRMEENRIEAANDIAKHINLLYQPIFAEAWVSEKLENGVDTACSLVESDLLRLRRRLPFLNDLSITGGGLTSFVAGDGTATTAAGAADSNMALIGAELHNKAGDLYFYKGRRAVPYDGLERSLLAGKRRATLHTRTDSATWTSDDLEEFRDIASDDGLLLRGHYHYAVGLHELRRFVTYRRLTSGAKMNPVRGAKGKAFPWLTIAEATWPTFVPQSIYNNLSDMAEGTLARTSFLSLLDGLSAPRADQGPFEKIFHDNSGKIEMDQAIDDLMRWFESTDDDLAAATADWQGKEDRALSHTLYLTLGTWAGASEGSGTEAGTVDLEKDTYPHLVTFDSIETTLERIVTGFSLSLAAADFARQAGYPEDAAREYMLILELCGRYVKWLEIAQELQTSPSSLGDLKTLSVPDRKLLHSLRTYLAEVAKKAAAQYQSLTWRAWRREPFPERCAIGQQVAPEVVTLLCALAENFGGDDKNKLMEIVMLWFGKCRPPGTKDQEASDTEPLEWLQHAKMLFRYPALNQLLALKVMIDHACLEQLEHPVQVDKEELDDLYAQLGELHQLYERFGAPLHFTPAMLGESAALVVRVALHGSSDFEKRAMARGSIAFQMVVRRGLESLTASRETYSMGRAYYSAIADLYYLYDDYNDRRIHANHAAQMAGSDLHAVLLEEMERAEQLFQVLS